MPRRGNSEGSIRKRADGRWEARIILADGSRQSFYAKTRQEAARELAQAVHDRNQGTIVSSDHRTVAQYLDVWLAQVQHEVEPSSLVRYERVVRTLLKPGLGEMQVARLTAQHVQTFYANMLKAGTSVSNVRYAHVVLHVVLDTAVRIGLTSRNVADIVDVPRLRRREMTPFTEEQARAFLEACIGHPYEALFVLALATGMRRGELLALKWDDIDFDTASLQVQRTLQKSLRGYVFAKPKTTRSRRRIALSATVLAALKRHRAQQAETRLKLGDAWTDLDLVFPSAVGRMYEPSNFVRYQFKPIIKRTGLPNVRLHDLRHTAATLLLAKGVNPKVVSEMLGHSNVSITLNVYGHVLPHMQQEAADLMDRVLWGEITSLGSKVGSN